MAHPLWCVRYPTPVSRGGKDDPPPPPPPGYLWWVRMTTARTSNDLLVTFASLYQTAHASSAPPPVAQFRQQKYNQLQHWPAVCVKNTTFCGSEADFSGVAARSNWVKRFTTCRSTANDGQKQPNKPWNDAIRSCQLASVPVARFQTCVGGRWPGAVRFLGGISVATLTNMSPSIKVTAQSEFSSLLVYEIRLRHTSAQTSSYISGHSALMGGLAARGRLQQEKK